MAKKCFEIENKKWNNVKGKLISEFGTVEKGMESLIDSYLKEVKV